MDYITEYTRTLGYQNKARRAAGRFMVAAIEAGIIPDMSPFAGCDALTVLMLAPVSDKRRLAAIKAYRAAYPVAA
jgi:hypothetical protein